jgi:hypothetical protein
MNKENDILKDNEFISQELKNNLGLNNSPIAIKLVFYKEEKNHCFFYVYA